MYAVPSTGFAKAQDIGLVGTALCGGELRRQEENPYSVPPHLLQHRPHIATLPHCHTNAILVQFSKANEPFFAVRERFLLSTGRVDQLEGARENARVSISTPRTAPFHLLLIPFTPVHTSVRGAEVATRRIVARTCARAV